MTTKVYVKGELIEIAVLLIAILISPFYYLYRLAKWVRDDWTWKEKEGEK